MVSLTPDDKRELRSLRLKWGFLIGIAWVVCWWAYLSAEHKAQLARQENCEAVKGVLSTAGCHASNVSGSTVSAVSTFFGVAFAIITSPLGFVAGHYAAKAKVENARVAVLTLQDKATRALLQDEESARQARLASAESANQQTRTKIHREEFILKLGSVSDLIKLLPTAADDNTRLLITQAIEKELRELVAKHPLPDLKALIAGDEAIQFKLQALAAKVAEYAIDSDDAHLLLSAATASLA